MAAEYTILIVDDEMPARVLLTEYVNKIPQLKLVGCCSNAMETLAVINAHKVDILLTDIQMPDLSGVDLVKTLNNSLAVIFTTAYSDYALQGYELGVVDYLLKPIAFPRFNQAVNKAIQYLSLKEKAEMPVSISPHQSIRDYMIVKADRRTYHIKYDEILYIEGQREYVTFYTENRSVTALYSLKDLEKELPSTEFVRIHKSYIVAVGKVDFIDGTHVSVSETLLPIGSSFKEETLSRLG